MFPFIKLAEEYLIPFAITRIEGNIFTKNKPIHNGKNNRTTAAIKVAKISMGEWFVIRK
jgi:hypothetical protein